MEMHVETDHLVDPPKLSDINQEEQHGLVADIKNAIKKNEYMNQVSV
jgi:hypothetical protein